LHCPEIFGALSEIFFLAFNRIREAYILSFSAQKAELFGYAEKLSVFRAP